LHTDVTHNDCMWRTVCSIVPASSDISFDAASDKEHTQTLMFVALTTCNVVPAADIGADVASAARHAADYHFNSGGFSREAAASAAQHRAGAFAVCSALQA